MKTENIAHDLKQIILKDGHLSLAQRRLRLESLRSVIQKNELSIVRALKEDLGKSQFESYASEVGFMLEEIRFILKHLDQWARPRKVSTPLALQPGCSYVQAEPYGVVLIIAPWNYPFQLCLSPLVGAIAAGNRVVLKPSEFTPKTSEIIAQIIDEVFRPSEVVVVEGAVQETQELLRQHFDYIFFTGSTPVGKIIMKAAAEHLTPVTLELGGKSPCLIDESANLDLAARRCAWGKFMNAGQTCVAPDYVLVPAQLQDQFIERLNFHLQAFYGKKPETSPDYPRIINERHFNRLKALVIPEKVVIGGEFNLEQRYIAPTVMRDVAWEDAVMQDEIFGPVLPVLPYHDLEAAISKILQNAKPLAFYLFTENITQGKKLMQRLPFGGGCLNDTIVHLANPNLPFGGVGASGIGSYHGQRSFETFSHIKSIYQQTTKVDLPVRYPPYEGKLKLLKFFLR
jgi:aldehyde dehydrogenase (NAD+)